MKRQDCIPLHEAGAIYAVLTALSVGDVVPPEIYISDYKTGLIPQWHVRELEGGSPVSRLTLVDETAQWHLAETQYCVGIDVLTCVAKTLAGPTYGYTPGCAHATNPLCDIRQNARQIADRMKAGLPPRGIGAKRVERKEDRAELEAWNAMAKR